MTLLITGADDTAELLEAVRGGSLDALGDLYRRHADDVYTTAYRITGSPEEAEDVMQDVFVALPRALSTYVEEGRFSGWLNRVTVRLALMRRRSKRRKAEEPLDVHDPATSGERPDTLRRLRVEAAVGRLPESLRLVFVLKEIEGYSHAEISGLLGITPSASGARLSRAWARLRKELR